MIKKYTPKIYIHDNFLSPWQCPYCYQVFGSAEDLYRHTVSHGGAHGNCIEVILVMPSLDSLKTGGEPFIVRHQIYSKDGDETIELFDKPRKSERWYWHFIVDLLKMRDNEHICMKITQMVDMCVSYLINEEFGGHLTIDEMEAFTAMRFFFRCCLVSCGCSSTTC